MQEVFIKGMTYGWESKRGDYRTEEAVDSLKKLKATGSEWIALSFFTYQETYCSTEITFDYNHTMTDRDIIYAVEQAKELGLKVCLKPVVNSRDQIWRARIGFPEEAEDKWQAWFQSYRNFLNHYAELAEELECEMFTIGCEMVATEHRVSDWTKVIEEVRQHYSGPIIYNANHGKEEGVEWFNLVDFIGTSAYYPVADQAGESVEVMKKNWLPVKEKLAKLHEKFNKPIVFVEIGCRSAQGCATMPWDFEHVDLPVDQDEQANFYQSVLEVFWDVPWFAGFFWWDWSTKLYPLEEAATNNWFDIYGKKAEQVVREFYLNGKRGR